MNTDEFTNQDGAVQIRSFLSQKKASRDNFRIMQPCLVSNMRDNSLSEGTEQNVFVPTWYIRASRNNFRSRLERPNTMLVSIRVQHHELEDDSSIAMIEDFSDLADSTEDNTELSSLYSDVTFMQIVSTSLSYLIPNVNESNVAQSLLEYMNNISNPDSQLLALFDALPDLNLLYEFIDMLQNSCEKSLFKIVLDVHESILISLDFPNYENYEHQFLPVVDKFFSNLLNIDDINIDHINDDLLRYTNLRSGIEYVTYYRNKLSSLKKASFGFILPKKL